MTAYADADVDAKDVAGEGLVQDEIKRSNVDWKNNVCIITTVGLTTL